VVELVCISAHMECKDSGRYGRKASGGKARSSGRFGPNILPGIDSDPLLINAKAAFPLWGRYARDSRPLAHQQASLIRCRRWLGSPLSPRHGRFRITVQTWTQSAAAPRLLYHHRLVWRTRPALHLSVKVRVVFRGRILLFPVDVQLRVRNLPILVINWPV
jgi:hypothetical protein